MIGKWIKSSIAVLLFAALLSMLSVPGAANPEYITYESVLGIYEGTYTPSDGVLRGATMLVFMNSDDCQAVFHFYPIKGGGNSYSGSYLMDVNIDSGTGEIYLNGVEWIDQPSSYIFADFVVDQNGNRLESSPSSSASISLEKTDSSSFFYSGPHDHVCKIENVIASPTCTKSGQAEGVCAICSNAVKTTIDPLPHAFSEYIIVSGNKLIPPIVKEKTCSVCGLVETHNDWSNVWITALVGIGAIGLLIGFINYVRAFKNR